MNKSSEYNESMRLIWDRDENETKKFRKEFKILINHVMFERGGYRKEDHDDIIQEAYLRLCSMKKTPTVTVKPASFIKGIALRINYENRRTYKEDPTPTYLLERYAGSVDIIEQLEQPGLLKLLIHHYKKLRKKCRNLLSLYYRTDDCDEICKRLEISSKSLLYKNKNLCIKRLREMMMEDPECVELFNLSNPKGNE